MVNRKIDDEVHIGDWVYLGNTIRLFKVISFSFDTNSSDRLNPMMENGNGVITMTEVSTGNPYDAERNRVRKITDICLINKFNNLYPNI
jgi:hypothetical protein